MPTVTETHGGNFTNRFVDGCEVKRKVLPDIKQERKCYFQNFFTLHFNETLQLGNNARVGQSKKNLLLFYIIVNIYGVGTNANYFCSSLWLARKMKRLNLTLALALKVHQGHYLAETSSFGLDGMVHVQEGAQGCMQVTAHKKKVFILR